MTQALRDQMVELMPGLRWTQPMARVATGRVDGREIVRVIYEPFSRHKFLVCINDLDGRCQSPAHAAKTIRRKLREFRDLFDKALAVEETTP